MDREQIKARLDKLKVKYNAKLGDAKLLVILQKAENTPVEPQVITQEAIQEASEEPVKAGKGGEPNTAIIISESGQEVRRYTPDVHGEDFIALSKEYVSTHTNCTVKLVCEVDSEKCPHCEGKL